MIIDFSNYSANQRYHTMTQTLIPRPIAWVLTEHQAGHFNVAPFSYFTAVSSDPALIAFSVGNKDGETPKDTKHNLAHNPNMVVHIPSVGQASQVTKTSETLPAEESEVGVAELKLTDFEGFSLPRIETAPVAMACRLHQQIQIEGAPQTLILAEVLQVFVADRAVSVEQSEKAGRFVERVTIDANQIDPLARLGASNYAGITEAFKLKRPD